MNTNKPSIGSVIPEIFKKIFLRFNLHIKTQLALYIKTAHSQHVTHQIKGSNWMLFDHTGCSVMSKWIQTWLSHKFSILEKKNIWAHCFAGKKKGESLKALSWETYLWVTLGDFMLTNAKLEKGIYI